MTADAADLAALVSARLCHDLISPIGAIGNGLELLELAGEPPSPELALVGDSLATALAKLRFFRIAFGPADAGARLPREDAAQVCAAMFTGRLTVDWSAPDLPRPLARLGCLAILCLEKTLPLGGTLELAANDPAAPELVLRAEARRIAPPAELWAHAEAGAPLDAIRPDAVQFALLGRALAATGARLATRFDETAAEVRITAPAVLSPPAEARP
jgi:histidine phosphotransferase ChpT